VDVDLRGPPGVLGNVTEQVRVLRSTIVLLCSMRTTRFSYIEYRNAASEVDKLYHVSSWEPLSAASVGDTFVLKPGPQGAEGPGVYFSEREPRFTAAEGAQRDGIFAVVVIPQPLHPRDWYRTKGSVVRKFGRPRTWHSKGKNVRCTVESIEFKEGTPFLLCTAALV